MWLIHSSKNGVFVILACFNPEARHVLLVYDSTEEHSTTIINSSHTRWQQYCMVTVHECACSRKCMPLHPALIEQLHRLKKSPR